MQAIFVLLALAALCLAISVAAVLDGSDRLLKGDARGKEKALGWFLMAVSGGGFILTYTTLSAAVAATFFGSGIISSRLVTDFVFVAGAVTPLLYLFYRKTRKRTRRRKALT